MSAANPMKDDISTDPKPPPGTLPERGLLTSTTTFVGGGK